MSAVSFPHRDLSAILKRINIDASIKDYFKVRGWNLYNYSRRCLSFIFQGDKSKVQTFLGILSAFSCASHFLYRRALHRVEIDHCCLEMSVCPWWSLQLPKFPQTLLATTMFVKEIIQNLLYITVSFQRLMVVWPDFNGWIQALRSSTISWILKPISCQTSLCNRPYYNR